MLVGGRSEGFLIMDTSLHVTRVTGKTTSHLTALEDVVFGFDDETDTHWYGVDFFRLGLKRIRKKI
jgi:hypothetical protein